MSDLNNLLSGNKQQVRIGTVTESLGKNKYKVKIDGNYITAYTTLDNVKKGIPAVVTLTDKGWYIMGQPKNVLSTGVTEVTIPG